ncbi:MULTISPECIES: RnfABCDGE type electron transport complex subunit G [Tissierella]|uniref:Ion-translocating oxidoreductase complex subunit G n=1 Tax=Tissierella praeacuta DSM 18095 TaxID=1123404 RepID=A0A1M4S682_9FIRM|nr:MULTISPECIES: RnfABCDGE type electron transport complex subunit G [Tissierella]MBU5256731.1 RnfABCDGE type electron transport complex subunit G [Tissierella praeacuta]TCU71642.1 electron transport complex protein RnfG [Tissierella praeacuta]SHE27713.1 electron transport complex protein RnfG [Tissierella praeacuta DSM 18095]SUP00963.1 electron transport complex protein RnfG [Tissierella praeacuta]
MKETIKLGMILFLITVISAGVLAVSNNLTKGKIAEIEMAGSIGALKEIFGEEYSFKPLDEEKINEITESNSSVIEIFEAYDGENLYGYAIKTKSSGFGGDLVTLTGFASDGNVMGMRLLEHSETPGIGAKAAEADFSDKFVGKGASEEIKVEAISGATITSKGVMAGVNIAREVFNTELSN